MELITKFLSTVIYFSCVCFLVRKKYKLCLANLHNSCYSVFWLIHSTVYLCLLFVKKEKITSHDNYRCGGGVHKLSRFDNIPEHKGRPEDTSLKKMSKTNKTYTVIILYIQKKTSFSFQNAETKYFNHLNLK